MFLPIIKSRALVKRSRFNVMAENVIQQSRFGNSLDATATDIDTMTFRIHTRLICNTLYLCTVSVILRNISSYVTVSCLATINTLPSACMPVN